MSFEFGFRGFDFVLARAHDSQRKLGVLMDGVHGMCFNCIFDWPIFLNFFTRTAVGVIWYFRD